MKKRFVAKIHEEYGMLGLIEVTAPDEFEPLTGMGTAHDCLEHFPGDDGSIDHEFQALGSILWIRGIGGYWSHLTRDYSNNIATEMSEMLWRLFYYDNYTMRPAMSKRKPEHYVLDKAIQQAKADILADFEMNEEDFDHDKLEHFLSSARYWIHKGYARAKKRYPDPEKVCHIFREIESEVDRILKHAYEHQQFEISYNLQTTRVVITEIYEEDEDY